MTENAELKSPPKSSKSPTFVSSPSKLDQEDNVIKLTTLSSKYLILKIISYVVF